MNQPSITTTLEAQSPSEADAEPVELVPSELFTVIPRVTYSRGIRYLMSHDRIPWLVNTIARHLGTQEFCKLVEKYPPTPEPHLWCLEVDKNKTGKLTAWANCKVCYLCQDIPYTSCPPCCRYFILEKHWQNGSWYVCLPIEQVPRTLVDSWHLARQSFRPLRAMLMVAAAFFLMPETDG